MSLSRVILEKGLIKTWQSVTAWHCQYPLTVMWIALELIEPTHSWSPEVVYHMFGLRVVQENYPVWSWGPFGHPAESSASAFYKVFLRITPHKQLFNNFKNIYIYITQKIDELHFIYWHHITPCKGHTALEQKVVKINGDLVMIQNITNL